MIRKKEIKKCVVITDEHHFEAMLWCHNIGIKVYPIYKKHNLHIEIFNPLIKNRLTLSKESYTNCESQQQIWDLYVKLYEKYKNKI